LTKHYLNVCHNQRHNRQDFLLAKIDMQSIFSEETDRMN